MKATFSRILRGLKHPRSGILYLLLGKDGFSRLATVETCSNATVVYSPIGNHLRATTDIHEHLTTLYMLACEFKCKTILELGTRSGESTLALTLAAKKTHGKVYSIDIEECRQAEKLIIDRSLSDFWEFIRCDDLEIKWERKIDFLFIDTSHTYEQTFCELSKFEPMVEVGGIIVLHDSVSCSGVIQAIVDYIQGKPDLSVYEYLNNNGLCVVFKENPQ